MSRQCSNFLWTSWICTTSLSDLRSWMRSRPVPLHLRGLFLFLRADLSLDPKGIRMSNESHVLTWPLFSWERIHDMPS